MFSNVRLLSVSLLAAPLIVAGAGLGFLPDIQGGDGAIKLVTAESDPRPEKPREVPRIQLALLLDTSSSMSGLIHQAQAQLWRIVNELSACRKEGRAPELEVAMYEYGNTTLPPDGGWVRQVLPFTDNLDDVSEKLFALTTQGGDEYCGRVIQAASRGLTWDDEDCDLKIIVIAGNEPFTQGPVDYKQSCRYAARQGITINTIYCGDRGNGIATKWRHGARLGGGEYSHIDQNSRVIEVKTPYDEKLARLSGQLNETYLFYGKPTERERLARNQAAQDANAGGLGPAIAASRAGTKAGSNYDFERDLVEMAPTEVEEALAEPTPAKLPEVLRGKSRAAQKSIIKKNATQRKKIENEIQELTEKRNAYLAKKRRAQAGPGGEQSLGDALLGAVQEQARHAGFTTEK